MGSFLFDAQGIQSLDYRDRGIARYVREHALALERRHPDLVESYVLNPNLPSTGDLEPLVAAGKLAMLREDEWPEARTLHIASPIELSIPLDQLWPAWAARRRMNLVVTLYDLIPMLQPDHYLADPGLRSRYLTRLELVRAADRVLTISRATADDAIRHLQIDPKRIQVIGGGTSARFRPPESREAAVEHAMQLVPGLEQQFVMYTGGTDERKNIDRLLLAYATLDPAIQQQYQLAVICFLTPPVRARFENRVRDLGIDRRVLLPGHVTDEAMLALYQGTELFVFPSTYEGYGLPVAEAMACGAPAIGGRGSSIVELLEDDAMFDPYDVNEIAKTMTRALQDTVYRETLLARSGTPPQTWDDVADLTAAVYSDLAESPAHPRSTRMRIAFVTPLPPTMSGVAEYSYRLLAEMAPLADVDVFAEGQKSHDAPSGLQVFPVDRLHEIEAVRGGYDHVVYSIGNSEFHAGALAAIRRRPGVVLAHDVRLIGLYALCAHRPDAVPGGFHQALHKMYPDLLPEEFGRDSRIEPALADSYGITMTREIATLATRVLTTSEFAYNLARLDAEPADRDKILRVPFAFWLRPELERSPQWPPVIASFGFVNAVKHPALIVQAFARVRERIPDAQLLFVGPAGKPEQKELNGLLKQLGLREAVTITDEVTDAEYERWLAHATIAVQLRARTNGESSATIGDCLGAGVPTIVTEIGANRDIPHSAALKLPAECSADTLATAMLSLLEDEGHRKSLGESGRAWAKARSTKAAAEALIHELMRHNTGFRSRGA